MSKAGEMFDAYYTHSSLEEAMNDALMEACGILPRDWENYPHDDITYDYYDNSFEFKGVKGDWCPTEEQLAACWALGFSRCWICYAEGTMQKRVLTSDGDGGTREEMRDYPRERFFAAPLIARVFPGEPEPS